MKKLRAVAIKEAKRERRNKEERDRLSVVVTSCLMQMAATEAEHHAMVGNIAGDLNERIRHLEGTLNERLEELGTLVDYIYEDGSIQVDAAPVAVRNICIEYKKAES